MDYLIAYRDKDLPCVNSLKYHLANSTLVFGPGPTLPNCTILDCGYLGRPLPVPVPPERAAGKRNGYL
jgi:hypothetical protein